MHVLRDELVLEMAQSRLPSLLEDEWLDLTKLDQDMLDELRQQCSQTELNFKLVVTVLGGSSLEEQLPVLDRYPMQVEVCTVSYSRVWGGFVGRHEAQVRGSLTASWSSRGPMPDRYRDVSVPSSVPGAPGREPTGSPPREPRGVEEIMSELMRALNDGRA